MSINDGSEVLHSEDVRNSNNNEYKPLDNDNNHSANDAGGIDKVLNHICRHYNWVIVLMLTPISLIYDLYSFRKYININLMWK